MNGSALHLSSEDLCQGDGIRRWGEFLNEKLHTMDVSAPQDERFFGRMDTIPFGPATLSTATGSPQRAVRGARQIAHSEAHYFTILYARTMPYEIQQYGRAIIVQSGQYAIYDTKEPYVINFPVAIDCLGVQMEQGWLRRWLPHPEDAVARAFGMEPWNAALVASLQALSLENLDNIPLAPGIIVDQIGAMLALAHGRRTEQSTHQHNLLTRLRQTLRERCHEPDFNPCALAQVYQLSKRYVHLLFMSAGTSFGEELMAARLDQAVSMLQSPHFSSVSINDIAWRCGFSTPGHFARRFRQRFEVSPSQYRRELYS